MQQYENEHLQKALDSWRAAARKDPSFALAHLFISEVTYDPTEQKGERRHAKSLARRASRGEQLLITWLAGTGEEQQVIAIVAMNDLLDKYPKDRRLLFLAGRWLRTQDQYESAARLLERAVALDSNYAAAWNQLAFCYGYNADYPKAFAAMERYIRLLPKDPTPQNSYAELLRMAGNFRGALAHYQLALKIDPSFDLSQLGIADTYALLGDEATARYEYDKAIHMTHEINNRIRYELQSALTYLRERKNGKAVAALNSVAKQAHSFHLTVLEAESFRDMALCERDQSASFKYLVNAETALAGDIEAPTAELHREQAQVLRIQAIREAAAGQESDSAQTLKRLELLVNEKRDTVMRHIYNGATGSSLLAEKKYAQAIPYLEEDPGNPLSMQALILAYSQTGANDRAHVLELKLTELNVPTIEQALVVPDLRAKLVATKEKRGWFSKLAGRN